MWLSGSVGMSLISAGKMLWVWGRSGLHNTMLYQKYKKKKPNNNDKYVWDWHPENMQDNAI